MLTRLKTARIGR